MKINIDKNSAMTFLLFSVLLGKASGSLATFYPNVGDLYYNGQYFLNAYLVWDSPGPWLYPGNPPEKQRCSKVEFSRTLYAGDSA